MHNSKNEKKNSNQKNPFTLWHYIQSVCVTFVGKGMNKYTHTHEKRLLLKKKVNERKRGHACWFIENPDAWANNVTGMNWKFLCFFFVQLMNNRHFHIPRQNNYFHDELLMTHCHSTEYSFHASKRRIMIFMGLNGESNLFDSVFFFVGRSLLIWL